MEAEGAEGTARSAVRCGAHDPGWVTLYSRCVPLSFPPPPPSHGSFWGVRVEKNTPKSVRRSSGSADFKGNPRSGGC